MQLQFLVQPLSLLCLTILGPGCVGPRLLRRGECRLRGAGLDLLAQLAELCENILLLLGVGTDNGECSNTLTIKTLFDLAQYPFSQIGLAYHVLGE